MDNLPSKYTDQVIQAVTFFFSPVWRSPTTFQRITFSLTIPKRKTRIARFYGVFMCMYTYILNTYLVGGFNLFEKYQSNWKSSPNRGENKKYLKPPPSYK